jgi:hypothetical protein
MGYANRGGMMMAVAQATVECGLINIMLIARMIKLIFVSLQTKTDIP